MNILYTNFHTGHGGGHTTYVLALLQNPEHNKFVACPPSSRLYKILAERGMEREGRLIPLQFPSGLGRLPETARNTRALIRAIDQHDIDIVHTNGSSDNRMALYASPFVKKKFKTVFTKHNTYKVKGAVSLWRLNKFNAAVIFVSGQICKTIGLDSSNPRYHVIDNCIDLDFWKKNKEIHTGEHLTLVSSAGTARHKGWTYLVDAIDGLPEAEKKRLSIILMGRHEPEMEDDRPIAATKCDITYTGFLEDTRPYLEKGDIGFVLSYKAEASSFASREMSAMSLPVMISDFPVMRDYVDQSCGWVTRAQDAESIRETLRKILAMPPEELNGMKRAARLKAEREFSIQRMLEATNKVYSGII
ncbi:MAG: glycosyltransferase [Deltaproteobacteria bacterium]|jgi:glycosyltransferase involved in cell wall biosynthesis|nr:glycosyltransferase [Deltaproteobacteria bacterium]